MEVLSFFFSTQPELCLGQTQASIHKQWLGMPKWKRRADLGDNLDKYRTLQNKQHHKATVRLLLSLVVTCDDKPSYSASQVFLPGDERSDTCYSGPSRVKRITVMSPCSVCCERLKATSL